MRSTDRNISILIDVWTEIGRVEGGGQENERWGTECNISDLWQLLIFLSQFGGKCLIIKFMNCKADSDKEHEKGF